MKRMGMLILCTWLGVATGSAEAQFFFNPFRKAAPAVPPAERVGQLLAIIKGDQDERKRTQAVEELRGFDASTFPEIVSVLADVAQNDKQAGVRAEAVSSLVRIRPVSNTAGLAIEHAAAKDENWRNRMNAQASLVRYRLAGYSSTAAHAEPKTPPAGTPPAGGGSTANQSQEPPLGTRPPIIYHDKYGNVIPAPKNVQAPVGGPNGTPPFGAPVFGTPTSNPNVGKQPFAPIGPSTVPPQTNVPALRLPPPFPVAPAVPQQPTAIEPVFRNLDKGPALPTPGPLVLTPPQVTVPVTVPAVPVVPALPTLRPATPSVPDAGPSLDLPPLPINPTPAPSPSPAPAPSEVSGPVGRMDPSPRLEPLP